MNYKLFFAFLITNLVSFPLNASYTYSTREEEKEGRAYVSSKDKKRKGTSLEVNKENQRNINIPTKRQYLSKPKNKNSPHYSEASALSKLIIKVNDLKKNIEEAYMSASKMDLYASYNAFKTLNYNEQAWTALGQQMNIERWPSQESWKETVGGHLFFPASRIHQYQECSYTEPLIQRADILHGCIFASTFRHSLGLFYTIHILWSINRFEDDIQADVEHNKPNFYTQTMEKACQELGQLLDRPDVCYALGQASSLPSSLIDQYVSMEPAEFYKKGGDLKNRHKFLIAKMVVEEETESIIDSLLSLARQGYFPAYLEAADYANNIKLRNRAKLILEEATQKGYFMAWVELAHWYKKGRDLNKYQECLDQAVQANVSRALILQGFNLLKNNDHQLDREELKKVSVENINLAAAAFLKAGQLHDPLGFEYLAELKLNLFEISTTPNEATALRAEAYDAIKQGCALGWVKSFWKLPIFASGKEYEEILRKYGPAPDDFTEALKNFLKENTKTKIPH